MVIYDFIHAYQPYDPKVLKPDWVYKNLSEIFIPTSNSLNEGYLKRAVNIKGWTLDNWHRDKDVSRLAIKVIGNINRGRSKKHLEVGFSSYSHAILPLLSENILEAQIKLDYKTVSRYLGEPMWFWPPEGAVDKKTLEVIYKFYPGVIVVIPDLALDKINFSGIGRIRHGNGFQKVIIMNSLLKDVFMNAHVYKPIPPHITRHSDYIRVNDISKIAENPAILESLLREINPSLNVLMRDWENAGSLIGLRKVDSTSKIGELHLEHEALLNLKGEFKLPSSTDFDDSVIYDITEIVEASWELIGGTSNPYIYWNPQKDKEYFHSLTEVQQLAANEWYSLIKKLDEDLNIWIERYGGVDNILRNKKLEQRLKDILPAFMSCIPWHFLANKVFGPDIEFTLAAKEKIMMPRIHKLSRYLLQESLANK